MESNRIKFAKQLIVKHFSFLTAKGYSVEFEIKNDPFFSEYLIVNYKNAEKKREVGVSYAGSKVNEIEKYSFRADIVRRPYSGPVDFFDLSIFLKSEGKDFPNMIVYRFNEEEAEELVIKTAEALQTYASEVIDGTAWLDGHYPK